MGPNDAGDWSIVVFWYANRQATEFEAPKFHRQLNCIWRTWSDNLVRSCSFWVDTADFHWTSPQLADSIMWIIRMKRSAAPSSVRWVVDVSLPYVLHENVMQFFFIPHETAVGASTRVRGPHSRDGMFYARQTLLTRDSLFMHSDERLTNEALRATSVIRWRITLRSTVDKFTANSALPTVLTWPSRLARQKCEGINGV